MSNITQEQRETLALIDAIMAMFENKGEDENLNIGLSLNPFDFLFKIIEKYSSYEEVVDWLVTFLTASLPAIELSVKGIILANLKGMVDCNIDPRIPNFLRKELYTDNSEENGIFFNLSSIDYSGMLKISPLSPYGMNRYFGTRKYYSINDDNPKVKDKKFYKYQDAVQTCINLGINPQNIEDKSEITNVHELARAKDFNAFLWYVIHKAFYLNPKEINDVPLSTYSNSYTVKDDDGNDVQFTKKPFEDSDAKTFLEKVDGHVRLTLNYKTPPFVPGDVVTTAMGGNTYSLCISSVTSNQYAQKVQEPMYGDYGSDYVMLETTVVGYAPRDYDFTIVPMSDDLKSLNWYKSKLEEINDQLLELAVKMQGVSSPAAKDVVIENKNPYQNNLVELIMQEELLVIRRDNLSYTIKQIETKLNELPEDIREICIELYIKGRNAENVAAESGYVHKISMYRAINKEIDKL